MSIQQDLGWCLNIKETFIYKAAKEAFQKNDMNAFYKIFSDWDQLQSTMIHELESQILQEFEDEASHAENR